ncbi:hypothetical protein ACMAVT_02335 [Streptomyces sp. FW42]
MFLEDGHVHALSGEEQSRHHARGATADDDAPAGQGLHCLLLWLT